VKNGVSKVLCSQGRWPQRLGKKLPPEVQDYIRVLENALCQSLYRIAQLEQKVNELAARLAARLDRHSGSSSQPPSQAPPHAPKNQGEKSLRHPGGQPGHQGNHELPQIQPIITQRRLVAGWRPHCRVWVKPELPAGVGRNAFGPRPLSPKPPALGSLCPASGWLVYGDMSSFFEPSGSLLNCHEWFPIAFPFTSDSLSDHTIGTFTYSIIGILADLLF
jgi:hypothetical protein